MTIEEEELLDAYIERVAELEAELESKELQKISIWENDPSYWWLF